MVDMCRDNHSSRSRDDHSVHSSHGSVGGCMHLLIFDVVRYPAPWAHIAQCADITWTAQPPDEFIIANQRLWARHCRISQFLQDIASEPQSGVQTNNQLETTEKRTLSTQNQDNGSCSRSVKEVIPESRLAQFYGNFYYDEVREKCYTNENEKRNGYGHNGKGCEKSDLTECWMLPEVEYWFRKLVDDSSDRSAFPRRRRQYRMLADDDFERWGPVGAQATGEEAVLASRLHSVRTLWDSPPATRDPLIPRAPSPPPPSRKIRARRRQPKRLTALAPPPPAYCLEVPMQLLCDPSCKVQFYSPRPPQLNAIDYQRAMGRLSNVQAVIQASAARCPLYRGTNVSRYAPTAQRPTRYPDRRYGIWWPRDHPSPKLDHKFQLPRPHYNTNSPKLSVKTEPKEPKHQDLDGKTAEKATSPSDMQTQQTEKTETKKSPEKTATEKTDRQKSPEKIATEKTDRQKSPEKTATEKTDRQKSPEKTATDKQVPSTSPAAIETVLRKKRLYSTVLSMSTPPPILTPVGCVRLSQKLVQPGILKLNPKILLPTARIRPPNVDNKFEELEKEALEQYKASDESIDTKLSELEKQAVDQYSTSNSNTSCSSGNSGEKAMASSPSAPDDPKTKKQMSKFKKEKVDSVVIYSQNFPDLNTKAQSVMNLKNFHTPPRGEKKEQARRPKRSLKNEQRAASDTDYEVREAISKQHKGPMRWSLHATTPKKRHLTLCVSDGSSDEDLGDASRSIKDAGPCIRRHVAGKVKLSAHGGGDLVIRKT